MGQCNKKYPTLLYWALWCFALRASTAINQIWKDSVKIHQIYICSNPLGAHLQRSCSHFIITVIYFRCSSYDDEYLVTGSDGKPWIEYKLVKMGKYDDANIFELKSKFMFDRFSRAFRQDSYMKACVFVVQTASVSGSSDLAARSRQNTSPSQRNHCHCSSTLQSYLRLITSLCFLIPKPNDPHL